MRYITFEISARIVAGTSLYPGGSPYTVFAGKEHLSTGRRIAQEIREGIKTILNDLNSEKIEQISIKNSKLKPSLAPIKVGIFPLVKKDGLFEKGREIFELLREEWPSLRLKLKNLLERKIKQLAK